MSVALTLAKFRYKNNQNIIVPRMFDLKLKDNGYYIHYFNITHDYV